MDQATRVAHGSLFGIVDCYERHTQLNIENIKNENRVNDAKGIKIISIQILNKTKYV